MAFYLILKFSTKYCTYHKPLIIVVTFILPTLFKFALALLVTPMPIDQFTSFINKIRTLIMQRKNNIFFFN